MEALATAHPARFSTECQSLAPHTAAVLMRATASTNNTETSRTSVDEDAEELLTNGNAETDMGVAPSTNEIEERKALELWVDFLGICLLPFCGRRNAGESRAKGDNADGEDIDGFHSDDDSDDESEGDDEGDGGVSHGKARSGWVKGWMRRAGMAGTETPKCPFDLRSGGRDEDLPLRLAVMIASRVKVIDPGRFGWTSCFPIFRRIMKYC